MSLLLCLLACTSSAWALWKDPGGWRYFRDGSDMQHFVTRPELKAPRYMVAKHIPEAITEGYWFVTPYTRVGVPPTTEQKDFMPCMNGAHIYDGDGNLVWSGACKYDNRNVFNFRPVRINGTDLLTFFLPGEEHGFDVPLSERLPSGVLMDNHYEEVSRTNAKGFLLDGHEFNILDDGKSVLLTTLKGVDADASSIGQETRRVTDTGFQEAEMGTGRLLFNWDPVTYGVPLNESCDTVGMQAPSKKDAAPWDFFHINSVDKFANGDYLISSRHMSTLYRISKDDGHIIWTLGGCHNNSDFVMEEGLPFFWQHHARVQFENETHTIVSVFDNASEDKDRGEPTGANPPSGKIMILDTASVPMTAKMLRRFDRPDQGQTAALGSVTVLGTAPVESANIFIDWAFEGYVSEYDGEDRLVMEAKFISDRKRSYRAYKFPFVGSPTEPPVLAVLSVGWGNDEVASAFYVSWNGATEVASWAFYGGKTSDPSSMKQLSVQKRRGFETNWVLPGKVQYAYAEALDREGRALGKTEVATITPSVDERYQIPYPVLSGASSVDGPSASVVSEDLDMTSYAADVSDLTPDGEDKHIEQLPPPASSNSDTDSASNDASNLVHHEDIALALMDAMHNHPPNAAHHADPLPPVIPAIPLEPDNADSSSPSSSQHQTLRPPARTSDRSDGQCEWRIPSASVNHAAYVVVDAFAVFGLWYAVRGFLARFSRRRGSYSALPSFSEEK